jgi:bacteriocin biosynthesis cyclodehydratase domain-containing protein
MAVRALLTGMPCGSVSVLRSSSVAEVDADPGARSGAASSAEPLPRPRTAAEWTEELSGCDWVVAAQDCFEPEELAALNEAALRLSTPWSLVCFDGYEGWVGPTFVPGQTACFSCFQARLFAGASNPKHVFMNPRVKVHRVPSPWSTGPETGAWVSLITSIFALELVSAMRGRSFTLSEMLIVHRLNLTFQRESVLRLPRCPVCSPRAGQPVLNVFSQLLSTRETGRHS